MTDKSPPSSLEISNEALQKLALAMGMMAGTLMIRLLPQLYRRGLVDAVTLEMARDHLEQIYHKVDLDDEGRDMIGSYIVAIELSLAV